LSNDKSIKSLIDVVVDLRHGSTSNAPSSIQSIADNVDLSASRIGIIYSARVLPDTVISQLNIHQPEGDGPNKLYPKRYLSLGHVPGLLHGAKNLSEDQFEREFLPVYKESMPDSRNSIPHARRIVGSINNV